MSKHEREELDVYVVFKLSLLLTGKIIVLCLTSLPLAIFGLLIVKSRWE